MGVPERTARAAARCQWAHESSADVPWTDVAEEVKHGYEARSGEVLAAVSDPATVAPDGQPLGDDALVPLGWVKALLKESPSTRFAPWEIIDREARR